MREEAALYPNCRRLRAAPGIDKAFSIAGFDKDHDFPGFVSATTGLSIVRVMRPPQRAQDARCAAQGPGMARHLPCRAGNPAQAGRSNWPFLHFQPAHRHHFRHEHPAFQFFAFAAPHRATSTAWTAGYKSRPSFPSPALQPVPVGLEQGRASGTEASGYPRRLRYATA